MPNKTIIELQNDLINKISKKEEPRKIIIDCIDKFSYDVKDEMDIPYLKELALEIFDTYKTAYFPKNEKEVEEAYSNTLSDYIFYNMDNNLNDLFWKLAQYDKIIIIDDKKYLFKLSGLLYILNNHYEKLEKYKELYYCDDLIERGTALSTNPKVEDFITPRIKSVKEILKIDKHNKSNNLLLNILVDYQNNPLEMDYCLKQVSSFDKSLFKNINHVLLNTLFSTRGLLNSACSIDEDDIYESARIYIIKTYWKDSHIDKCLNIKNKLSHSKIATYTNEILEKVFNMPNSNIKYYRVKQDIQLNTNFEDLELYQFRTNKNYKKHPFLE